MFKRYVKQVYVKAICEKGMWERLQLDFKEYM